MRPLSSGFVKTSLCILNVQPTLRTTAYILKDRWMRPVGIQAARWERECRSLITTCVFWGWCEQRCSGVSDALWWKPLPQGGGSDEGDGGEERIISNIPPSTLNGWVEDKFPPKWNIVKCTGSVPILNLATRNRWPNSLASTGTTIWLKLQSIEPGILCSESNRSFNHLCGAWTDVLQNHLEAPGPHSRPIQLKSPGTVPGICILTSILVGS